MDKLNDLPGTAGQTLRLGAADATPVLQARRTLQQHGQRDAVELIDRSLQGVGRTPAIVVAGEVKRGKSMLVNALCGALLSPTSSSRPSLAVVGIGPASADLPLGWADVVRPSGTQRVRVEQATAELDPDHPGDEPPLMARLSHASRWLPEALLLDTPGVGGLGTVQGHRTSLAAAEAEAVVFVTDGGQPITAPELRFLQEISEHVEHVVLVLAKVDRNPTTWAEIRVENARNLRTYAPRFADHEIHPVSAAYAMHALTQTGDLAARLEQASGVPQLAEVLQSVVTDRRRLAVANALRIGHSGLSRLAAAADLEIRALSDPGVPPALEAEQVRLADLQLQLRRARMDLERDLGRIRQAAVTHVNDASEELTTRMAATISKEKRGMKGRVRDQFAADLLAELNVLAAGLTTFVHARLTELVTEAFGSLETLPVLEESLVGDRDVDLRVRNRPSFAMNPLFDPALAGAAFMGSKAAGMAAAYPLGALGVTMTNPVTLTVGVIGGAAMIALNVLYRGTRQGQQDLAGTLFETLSGARADLIGEVDSWLRELRPELHIALEDHLKASITTVRGVIEVAQRSAQADAATRAKSLEQAVRRREALVLRRDAVHARLLEGAGASAEQSPPPSSRSSEQPTTDGQAPDPDLRSNDDRLER